MKRISHRTVFLLILMIILLLGLVLFAVQYFFSAKNWVTFSGSPHVYIGNNLSAGQIRDREGALLLNSVPGRTYNEDAAIRRSTMHLLGDRYGYISAPVLNQYSDQMIGFDVVNGLYGAEGSGTTAHLTISAQVQKTALEALQGRKGTIGVYNYKTGEILCAVTSPTYDPDQIPDVNNDQTGAYDGVYLHRFFQTTYVPGSVFKVVTAAAALENLEGIDERTFYCGGSCDIEGDTIQCNGVHGTVDLKQALAHSCNVVFGQIAAELGKDVLQKYVQHAGVTETLDVDGIKTAAGQFDLTQAVSSQVAWSGIGQHTDMINACQYMTVMGAVANGGQAAVPFLMQEISGGGMLSGYQAGTKLLAGIMEPHTADVLTEMMRQAVVQVYGQGHFPDLYVCAKSGTAELGTGTTPHATFAGFIRDEKYPLAFVVIVENGGSGSTACTPIAGQVLHACVNALDRENYSSGS